MTRQYCDAPDLVLERVSRLGSGTDQQAVMRRCRLVLEELGFGTVVVIDTSVTANTLTGPAAALRIEQDEIRAARDEQWWTGDVCWMSPATGAHVVVPEAHEWNELRFVAWGEGAEQVLSALVAASG